MVKKKAKKKSKKKIDASNKSERSVKDYLFKPSLYKPEYIKEILEYFSIEKTKVVVVEKAGKEGIIHIVEEHANPPPTFYGFAASRGHHIDTILKSPEDENKKAFGEAYKISKCLQADFIIGNAMTNKAPSSFAKFMMSTNFGWTDRVESNVNGKMTLEELVNDSMKENE